MKKARAVGVGVGGRTMMWVTWACPRGWSNSPDQDSEPENGLFFGQEEEV